jgi:hypothetical protein
MSRTLSDQLARLAPPDTGVPPNFTQLLRSCNRVLDDYGRTPRRASDPWTQLQVFQGRIERDDWVDVPLSLVMEAAEHAFSPEFRDRDDLASVRRFFLKEIPASDRPGFLGAMTRVYIETFDAAAAHTRALAQALVDVANRLGAQWRKLLEAFPDLFDPARIVERIAARMTEFDDIWSGLKELGLRQPHAPGLMAHAHVAFLEQIAPRLAERKEIERVLDWLSPPGQPAMATGAAEAVIALLRPWKKQGISEELKQLLIDRLLDLYGHPKVNRNSIWNQIPQKLEGLFLHWIAGADIRMLFRVLTEVERGHMWADREKFWWSLHKNNRIDEVWVAFNREGYRAAMSRLPRDTRHDAGQIRFALQEGERDKSLLIMRIGRKIVVEGTYNFKVHVFDETARDAPKLYQRRYDVADIRSRRPMHAIPHLGNWQYKVSGVL